VNEPDVSVIIPVSQSHYAVLGRQLRQLGRQSGDTPFEVLVADNDGRLELPSGAPAGTVLVDASSSPGPAFARNVAAKKASGQVLLFTDADDLVCPHWVSAHCRALESTDFTGGPMISAPDDDPRWDEARSDTWHRDSSPGELAMHEHIPFVTSANCGIHRDVFQQAGGFPENYRWGEDVAFTLQVMRAGRAPTFAPEAIMLKHSGYATPDDERDRLIGLGTAHVALRRDFDVGPPLPLLLARDTARAAVRGTRGLISRDPTARAAGRAYALRLEGAIRELVKPGSNSPQR